MGTVTGAGGGADIGGYGARRTSGETGGESGTGSGEIEGGSVTILQLYAATEVPPEGVGRIASFSTRSRAFIPTVLTLRHACTSME